MPRISKKLDHDRPLVEGAIRPPIHRLTAAGTSAWSINSSGDIVGSYTKDHLYGFLYRRGNYTTLDLSDIETQGYGINASGQIVGSYIEKTSKAIKRHSFFCINGFCAAFDHPSAPYWTDAHGINDQGQIVGTYNNAGGDHGFLYDPNGNTYTTLDAP